jgi:hypothetical protein
MKKLREYIVLIVSIIVVLVVCFLAGRHVNGKREITYKEYRALADWVKPSNRPLNYYVPPDTPERKEIIQKIKEVYSDDKITRYEYVQIMKMMKEDEDARSQKHIHNYLRESLKDED